MNYCTRPAKSVGSESQYNGGDLVDAKYCSGKLRRNPKFLAAELQGSDSGVVTPKYPLQYRRRKNETQNEKRTSTEKRTSNEQDGTRGRLNDCKLAKKTNAVRASHPDRIVFAKSRCPFSTHEAWGRAAFHPHSEESGRRCYSADCHSRSRLRESTCSTTVVPAASPAVCGGLLRRPQRPGNQCAPRRASGGTLPIIHPRELPGTAGSAAMLWQGMQEISLECRHCALSLVHHQEKT
jgi:hypothetical protein